MNAIETLDCVLSLFKHYRNDPQLLSSLIEKDLLHPSFEKRYIINPDVYHFTVMKLVPLNENSVDVYLVAKEGCHYKAELIYNNKWYLKSFKFICQCCFADPHYGCATFVADLVGVFYKGSYYRKFLAQLGVHAHVALYKCKRFIGVLIKTTLILNLQVAQIQ